MVRAACLLLLGAATIAIAGSSGGCASDFVGDGDAGVAGSSSGSAASGSGSSSSGAAADTSCKLVRPDSALITPSNEEGTPASSTGGTLVDGVYVLDRLRLYNANPTVSWGGLKQTVTVEGNHYLRAYYIDAGLGSAAGAVAGTFTLESGARLLQTQACSDGATDTGSGPFEGTYSATGNELTIVQPSPYNADWIAELHYVRR